MTDSRAVVVTRSGGPDVMVMRDRPVPEPGPEQVLIQVAYAGVNFAELAARAGYYKAAPRPPFVLGFEVSGTILACGRGVTDLREGDRVLAGVRFGGYATHVVARAEDTRKLPEKMSLTDAAAIPVVYLTAYVSMVDAARVRKGESILIHACAGGVGLAAVQLARHFELESYGTASTEEKLALAREHGLAHGINYAKDDFSERIMDLTKGWGVDHVLESIGGDVLRKSWASLAAGGTLVLIGSADLLPSSLRQIPHTALELIRMKRFTPFELILTNRKVAGVQVLLYWDRVGTLRSTFEKLMELWEAGVVRPVIDRIFPMSQAPEAHRLLLSRGTKGKLLLDATK